ncbi:MAG: outer membrane beta-barrel protein [Planctomycetes bacterium]|nr:outer membrane beta-barrel protein [Planctomycetota bacterium]
MAPAAEALAQPAPVPPQWRLGQPLMQGYFGANLYETVRRTGGGRPTVDGSSDGLSQMPTIGGGAQWKLGGDEIQYGLEALLGFGWRSDGGAVVVGGGGAAVAVDVDLYLFDLYGGPFASMFLGDRWRLYASAGPMMLWGRYEDSTPFDDTSNSGFGLGWYARTGIELVLGGGTMIGIGARWSDAKLDLGSDGDLDLEAWQFTLSFSQLY